MKVYSNVKLSKNFSIHESVILGMPSRDYSKQEESKWPNTIIGENAVIQSGTVVYCDVQVGNNFQTGHNVLIRESTKIGNRVLIGTNSIVEGHTQIGSSVSIQSSVFIPTNTIIEDKVFIGPNAVLINDKYPIRKKNELKGPIIRMGASIGGNSTILPGIEIGEGVMVAAGAVVTKDVPPWKMALGCPAKIVDLPDDLKKVNLLGD